MIFLSVSIPRFIPEMDPGYCVGKGLVQKDYLGTVRMFLDSYKLRKVILKTEVIWHSNCKSLRKLV